MSTYTAFIYENHNLADHKPEWMRAERYEYCEQMENVTTTHKGLFRALTEYFKSSRA
ncbi:MAG: hypothetical protein IKX76_02605 [Eubacterium sp.]|nr:hypothetical protein [Eubacterium sp.]